MAVRCREDKKRLAITLLPKALLLTSILFLQQDGPDGTVVRQPAPQKLAVELSVNVLGITPTQAVIQFARTQTTPCRVRVTAAGILTTDFDPAIFAGADQDDRPGSAGDAVLRAVVAGQRRAERGLDGRLRSRAL